MGRRQENRIGIMSLLLQEITALSVQNHNSKCLLLTHDALAYYDLRNMLESVKRRESRHGEKIVLTF